MATQIYRVPGVSTNPNLPKFYVDSRLSKGSILLVDFSHDMMANSLTSNGAILKNIAYKSAMSLIGVTEANVSPSIVNTLTPNGGQVELTQKKGLHVIVSQVNDIGDGNDFVLKLPLSVVDYIRNNVSRGFYISIWNRTTRMYSGTGVSSDFLLSLTNTGNYIASLEQSGYLGTNNVGKNSEAAVLNQSKRNTVAINAATGTPPTGNSTNNTGYIFTGNTPYTSFELNKKASKILYQIHIVDLTAANLTYQQADALDLAEYNKAFGVGGRFANDTFTSPTTLP